MCPVTAAREYCKLRGPEEGPFFCFVDKTPIPRQFFTSQLQLSLKWCNKDIRNYKGHSFRIGSASHASSTGISDEQIQPMGRWNSNAFKKYIRIEMFKVYLVLLPRGHVPLVSNIFLFDNFFMKQLGQGSFWVVTGISKC